MIYKAAIGVLLLVLFIMPALARDVIQNSTAQGVKLDGDCLDWRGSCYRIDTGKTVGDQFTTPCSFSRDVQGCRLNKNIRAVCAENYPEDCSPVMKCEEWEDVYPCHPEYESGCKFGHHGDYVGCDEYIGHCVSDNYTSPGFAYGCEVSGSLTCNPKGDIKEYCARAYLPCKKVKVCKRWTADYPCDGNKVFGCIDNPIPSTESECVKDGCKWMNNTCDCSMPGPVPNPVYDCEAKPNCHWVNGECLCVMQSPEQIECEKDPNCAWRDGRCICVMPEPEEIMPGPVPNPTPEPMPGPVPNPTPNG